MKPRCDVLFCAILLLGAGAAKAQEVREWRDQLGKRPVAAELVEISSGGALVRRASDGRLFFLPVDSVSYIDRLHLKHRAPGQITEVLPKRYPSFVSRYEIAVAEDHYYARLVQTINGRTDLKRWPMLKQFRSEVGTFIGDVLDAPRIAGHITASASVTDFDSPLAPVREMVVDCAAILGVDVPRIYVKNDPYTDAYVFGVNEPSLVLTSGLLELYQDSPEELRFIIGHELGHLKCGHVSMGVKARAMLHLLRKVDDSALGLLNQTSEGRSVLTPLFFGQFLSWQRASDFTADRAGLLCCQDLQVAVEALWRLKHGVRSSSRFYDTSKQVDVNKILADFEDCERNPFVEVLFKIQNSRATSPFIEERMAYVQRWHDAGSVEQILSRSTPRKEDCFVTIDDIQVSGLQENNDVYFKAYVGDKEWIDRAEIQHVTQAARWKDFPSSIRIRAGQPVYFEIWDWDAFGRHDLLGAVIVYPEPEKRYYMQEFRQDIADRDAGASPGKFRLALTTLRMAP